MFVTWARGNNMDTRYHITDSTEYQITYDFGTSTLRIKRVSISRDNMTMYSCMVGLMPIYQSIYLFWGSETGEGNITLFVNGMSLDNEMYYSSTSDWILDRCSHCVVFYCSLC